MRNLTMFLSGTALALCLTLSAPLDIQAAGQSGSKTEKSLKKTAKSAAAEKSSKKAAKADKQARSEKSVKKSGKDLKAEKNPKKALKDEKSAKKTEKSARAEKSSKSAQAAKKSSGAAKSADAGKADSRQIWLDRARDSEILTGQASWYGKDFHNKATASGLDYDMHTFTAAHRTLPIGTIVKVTDQKKGKSVMVCVTDRGPFVRGRIIDLSYAAARKLDLEKRGVCRVNVEVVSDEKGLPLKPGQAYFVRYGKRGQYDRVGPFKGFADAAAMHEALRQAHPEAEVVLDSAR